MDLWLIRSERRNDDISFLIIHTFAWTCLGRDKSSPFEEKGGRKKMEEKKERFGRKGPNGWQTGAWLSRNKKNTLWVEIGRGGSLPSASEISRPRVCCYKLLLSRPVSEAADKPHPSTFASNLSKNNILG